MNRGMVTLLASALLTVAGCGDSLGITGSPDAPDVPDGLDVTGTRVELCDMDPITGYDFESIVIDGDFIQLTISYGGGCEDHHFRLCWDGEFVETEPVQTNLELIHDGHGDACMALITQTLSFSLLPLREAWVEAYGMDTGAIWIDIGSTRYIYSF